jgi:hypothetical protein
LADESAQDQVWSQELIDHVKQVQTIVSGMDEDSCRHLATSLSDIFTSLSE